MTSELLIKGFLYYLIKAGQARGGKYLSRKQITNAKTGKKSWRYDYGKKKTVRVAGEQQPTKPKQNPEDKFKHVTQSGQTWDLRSDVSRPEHKETFSKLTREDHSAIARKHENLMGVDTGNHATVAHHLAMASLHDDESKKVDPIKEEAANIGFQVNDLHKKFIETQNYFKQDRFANRNYRDEDELESQMKKVVQLAGAVNDKRGLTNLKKQFQKLQEMSNKFQESKTRHEERRAEEQRQAQEAEAQKQKVKAENDVKAKSEYEKLEKANPKQLKSMMDIVKGRNIHDSFGVVHVKPEGYYATDGRILVYNKADTGQESLSITPKKESGDLSKMGNFDNSLPYIIDGAIGGAKNKIPLDTKKIKELQAALKGKPKYVVMQLGDSKFQFNKDLLKKMLDSASNFGKPLELSFPDRNGNPCVINVRGKGKDDSLTILMPMKFDENDFGRYSSSGDKEIDKTKNIDTLDLTGFKF